MKIFYKKDSHLVIWFPIGEFKAGLAVLKGMAKHFKAEFIFQVARDLENDLRTPQLPFDPRYRICEACITEIDVRKDEHIVRDGRYTHKCCPVLKDKDKRV